VDGDDIHPLHELLGQRGLKMKRFHTRVLNRGERILQPHRSSLRSAG
jgi:hypothetical protein